MVVFVSWILAWLSGASGVIGLLVYVSDDAPGYGFAALASGASAFVLFAALAKIVQAADVINDADKSNRVREVRRKFEAETPPQDGAVGDEETPRALRIN